MSHWPLMNVILVGTSATRSNWTDFSCQWIKLVGKRPRVAALHHELSFSNHVHEFDASQDAFGALKWLEVEHRDSFHCPVFLDDVVQVFDLSHDDRRLASAIDLIPGVRLCLRNTFSSKGRNRIAQRLIEEWSTTTPRSCTISSKWRQLSGYAAYQRMHARNHVKWKSHPNARQHRVLSLFSQST